MSSYESWEFFVYCFDNIFEELHNVQSEVNDAGQ